MGGRELKYSLLTAYFMVTDENFKILGDLDLKIKPDDGVYVVSGQGMSVNKINLQEHDKVAMPYKQAKPLLYNFLKKYGEKSRLTPVGHGVKGDIAHILNTIASEGSWEQFCTYHYIDTSVVLQFLRACGKMPMDCDGSVEALGKYFDVSGETPNYHEASFDTNQTALVFQKMIALVTGKMVYVKPSDPAEHFREK